MRLFKSFNFFSVVFALIAFADPAFASSTIFDGFIEKVEKDKRSGEPVLFMRASNSPYSSVGLHSTLLSAADGRGKKTENRRLSEFMTYWIDDLPVTQEEILPLLVPGARVSLFENRSFFYFLRVATRSADYQVGFIKELSGNKLHIERPQLPHTALGIFEGKKNGVQTDGFVHLTYTQYPHLSHRIELAEGAVVFQQGKMTPWRKANLDKWATQPKIPDLRDLLKPAQGKAYNKQQTTIRTRSASYVEGRTAVIVQSARAKMRVEILPSGFSDKGWESVRNYEKRRSPWGKQLWGMHYGVMISDQAEKYSIDSRGYSQLNNGKPKVNEMRSYKAYLLAGGPEKPGKIRRGIYYKGEHVLLDNFFVNKGDLNWQGLFTPGQPFVAHIRRGRSTPDLFAIDSEQPIAWGTIRFIDGQHISLEAPEIQSMSVSGKQDLNLSSNAEYFYLGLQLDETRLKKFFKVGALIRVYPSRPQTVLTNKFPKKS